MAVSLSSHKGTADKTRSRLRRQIRARKKIFGAPERPRLVVTRSARHILAQVIDDTAGRTLASASTMEADLRSATGDKSAKAKQVGLHGGGGRERATGGVVDYLGQDVPGRTGDDEPRALGSTEDLLPGPDLTAQPRPCLGRGSLVRRQRDSHHLPAFPTLRRTCSPA